MAIEEVKHPDLQKAVKDIAAVLDIKQNHVAGRQVLIDFIVNTVNNCIGPDPENAEQSVWTDNRAGDLKPETINTYTALVTQNLATEQPEVQDGAEADAAEKAESEVVGEETGEQPKECPSFGKDKDPDDVGCQECKRGEECSQVIEAKATKKAKSKKTPEEKAAAKEARKAQREADKAAGKITKRSGEKSIFGHVKESQAGQIDALLASGSTMDDMIKDVGCDKSRITGHIKHLENKKNVIVTVTEGLYKATAPA